jgi:hypothetical protein
MSELEANRAEESCEQAAQDPHCRDAGGATAVST